MRTAMIFLAAAASLFVAGCSETSHQPAISRTTTRPVSTTQPSTQPTTAIAVADTPRPLSGHRALPTTLPTVAVRRVLIISVDGLRPDLMLRAATPNIRSLMKRGSFTCWAHTTQVAITLPSHTSMLTGVTPARHGVNWNGDLPAGKQVYPKAPTVMELAKEAGYTTAMVAGKSKFETLARPGTLDWVVLPKSTVMSDITGVAAAQMIHEHRPEVLFVHFASVDSAGHMSGWDSPQQLAAIELTDRAIGAVLAALDDEHLTDQTVIILSADHGGSGRGHGAGDERSRYIPWICAGPGIKQNYDLTSYRSLAVNTEDTFATACFLLQVPYDTAIDGKPVYEVLDNRELLQATTTISAPATATAP